MQNGDTGVTADQPKGNLSGIMREIVAVFYQKKGEGRQIDSFWDNMKNCHPYCEQLSKNLKEEYKDNPEDCPLIEIFTFPLNGEGDFVVWKKFYEDFPEKFDFSKGNIKIMVKYLKGNIGPVEIVKDPNKDGGELLVDSKLNSKDSKDWLYYIIEAKNDQ